VVGIAKFERRDTTLDMGGVGVSAIVLTATIDGAHMSVQQRGCLLMEKAIQKGG